MKKRFSVLLAVIMLLCAAPLPGLSGGSGFVPAAHAAEPVDSGEWGNISWVYDSEGTLTISGSGPMQDKWVYVEEEGCYVEREISWEEIPWKDYASEITAIVIEYGISSICENAFRNCTNVKKLTVPATLSLLPDRYLSPEMNPMWLYENPFMDMTASLESIDLTSDAALLPGLSGTRCEENCLIDDLTGTVMLGCKNSVIPNDGSIKAIAPYAFDGCDGLTSVTIPEGVETIGRCAFENCSQLSEISLPESLRSIGYGAFYGTAWDDAQPGGLRYLDNWLIDCNTTLTQALIRPGTVGIAGHALGDCYRMTEISVPDTVKYISREAFIGTPAAQSCILPEGVVSVDSWDSYFYPTDSENGLYYHNNILLAINWNELEEAEMTDIVVKEGTTCIAGDAFHITESSFGWYDHMDYATSVTFPNSLKEIPDRALLGMQGLTEISLGTGLEKIGERAFFGCVSLEKVTVAGNGETEIGPFAFAECGITQLTIGDGVKRIGKGAFQGCVLLSDVTIGDGVTAIDDEAFAGCAYLAHLTIGKKATQIGNLAFSMVIPSGAPDDEMTQLLSLAPFGKWTFFGMPLLQTLEVAPENPAYGSIDNCLIEKASGTLLACSTGSVIPSDGSVKTIGSFGLAGYEQESLTIPGSVTSIEPLAFMASSLHTLHVPVSVTRIAEGAFKNCRDLTDVVYAGPHCQWNRIDIGSDNDALLSAPGLRFISEHIEGEPVIEVITAPTCVEKGKAEVFIYCTACEQLILETTYEDIAPTGHTDDDDDGRCDVCGSMLSEVPPEDLCPYCQKPHDHTSIGQLTLFFHRIIYFFVHLFGKM